LILSLCPNPDQTSGRSTAARNRKMVALDRPAVADGAVG
jgi:hypothetical protein